MFYYLSRKHFKLTYHKHKKMVFVLFSICCACLILEYSFKFSEGECFMMVWIMTGWPHWLLQQLLIMKSYFRKQKFCIKKVWIKLGRITSTFSHLLFSQIRREGTQHFSLWITGEHRSLCTQEVVIFFRCVSTKRWLPVDTIPVACISLKSVSWNVIFSIYPHGASTKAQLLHPETIPF